MAEAERIKNSQLDMLEKISEFTKEQAKEYLLSNLENELVHEKAVKVSNFEAQIKDDCEAKARQYISLLSQDVPRIRFPKPQFPLFRCLTTK